MNQLIAQDQPSFVDSKTLDEFIIPFGEWIKQLVDWIDQNLGTLLAVIKWPFQALMDIILGNHDYTIIALPWVVVVVIMFFLAWIMRNVRVAIFVVIALTICGLLGPDYWRETAQTIGMIFVAVVLCALIGIPLGIMCGRMDGVWSVVRPTLDAMQVIHSFVYMLPVIFFFGIGEVPATMVTMVFALPPLVRLTNLGIRQVPEDVVEAARAFGAPERRVLTDVQLPLARPAIMTGLNQTLLLSISMLGIAAIMGAGGLGALVFRAINNSDPAQSASAGLALFLVAVVLDRMSQREEDDQDGSLVARIQRAWAARREPEQLLADVTVEKTEPVHTPGFAPATGRERIGVIVALVGSLVMIASLALTWSNGALVSAWARRDDEALTGAFSGWNASGGSWFALFVAAFGLLIAAGAAVTLTQPGTVNRLLAPDIMTLGAVAATLAVVGFIMINPAPGVEASVGMGAWIALFAGFVTIGGAATATFAAPFVERRPLPDTTAWARVTVAAVALVFILGGASFAWLFDERGDAVITPEIQAQIDELKAQAVADPSTAAANAQLVSNLANSARASAYQVNGLKAEGPGLGYPALLAGILALLACLPGAGIGANDVKTRWAWNAVVAGAGMGAVLVAAGWVGASARVADPGFVTGAGVLLTMMGGYFTFAAGRSVLAEFQRRRVYTDDLADAQDGIDAEQSLEMSESGDNVTISA